jgi:ribosome biogenesis protein MAK21
LVAVSAEEDEDDIEAGKRKRREDRKEKRKKRKEMPVFASADDYRAMIDGAASEED